MIPSVKIVVVGDGAVGKTSMLICFTSDKFPQEYVPSVFDTYTAEVECRGQRAFIQLWDTAGQEGYDRLRPLSYPNSDVFIVTFSITNRESLLNVIVKWYPELFHYSPDAAIVLVGTKADVRTQPHLHEKVEVSKDEAHKTAKKISAYSYVECSAMTKQGLKQVFDEAVASVLFPRKRMSFLKKCEIL